MLSAMILALSKFYEKLVIISEKKGSLITLHVFVLLFPFLMKQEKCVRYILL